MDENRVSRLFDLCMELPPDMGRLEAACKEAAPDELGAAALRLVGDCFLEYRDFKYDHGREPSAEELHSPYVPAVMRLFLEQGMDPNYIDEKDWLGSIMSALRHMDYADTAADTLRIMLEHGGDTALRTDGFTLFDEVDENVELDADDLDDRNLYNVFVHCWLVLMGYGGRPECGVQPVALKEGFSYDIFRQHELFDFTIGPPENSKHRWTMHIFYKETGQEVATL